jgi:uncharacterized protein (UPF0276 family)
VTRFPTIARPGLGVGMDLPWGSPFGLVRDPVHGDGPSPRTRAYLDNAQNWTHFFASWQPRSRSRLDPRDYFEAFDAVFGLLEPGCVRALHQTGFNLASAGPYDRGAVVDFTNVLIERYGLAWVNEDLGIWSMGGCQMPYPLPPYPTDAGLDTAIANTRFVQGRLAAPLLIEFPGYSEATTILEGPWHAYDFFRELIEQTGSPATLDTGHLLSYQWLQGKRGPDLYDELDRLPLDACFEIHLSGCQIVGDKFVDAHHGVLLDEQLRLLELLLQRCPNVRAITYEDPRYDKQGALIPRAVPGWERLKQVVAAWRPAASRPTEPVAHRPVSCVLGPAEAHLRAVLHGASSPSPWPHAEGLGSPIESGMASVSDHLVPNLLKHSHAGCGSLRKRYPGTIDWWLAANPEDTELTALAAAFAASSACAAMVELAAGPEGTAVEQAFYDFCVAEAIGDPQVREDEFLRAMMRAVATSPSPAFSLPDQIQTRPDGVIAISSQRIVHAVSGGRIIRGRLPDSESAASA